MRGNTYRRCIGRSRRCARAIGPLRFAGKSQPAPRPRTSATARRTQTARTARTAAALHPAGTTRSATPALMTSVSPTATAPAADPATVARARSAAPTCAAQATAEWTRIVARAVTVRHPGPVVVIRASRPPPWVGSVARRRTRASRTRTARRRTWNGTAATTASQGSGDASTIPAAPSSQLGGHADGSRTRPASTAGAAPNRQ
jgi:hypothetical protein